MEIIDRARGLLPLVACLALAVGCGRGRVTDSSVVQPNDNRVAAGRLDGDTLRLSLVVGMAAWYPNGADGPSATVTAIAEEGKPPQIPAPLIRVPEGTVIDLSVRNALADSAVELRGLLTRPARDDPGGSLAPGDSVRMRFMAGAPGTYYYGAFPGTPDWSSVERETAFGALVIDPRGGSPPDRVFVINIWGDPVDSVTWRDALAINGRSFPDTERLTHALGDSVRWRWVNASVRHHPMHLHGFYFRLDAKGDGLADSTFAPADRRLLVTEDMDPFSTMEMVWQPDRIGNWLFHCHIGFHVSPEAQLAPPPAHARAHLSGDFEQHMAGLVLAMTVDPPPGWRDRAGDPPRRIDLYVQEGRPTRRAPRALGYVIADSGTAPAPDSVDIPGRALVLTRGQPTDVTIFNRLAEPTAVHWHGLELESYSDGMAGWSGRDRRVAPPVMPGGSFTAHLSLPRAGTFMYHTHLNDHEQLTSGLYGALLVLEPGASFDPTTDHVYVVGWDGPGEPPQVLLNGDSLPPAEAFRLGARHRVRFVNIGMAMRIRFSIVRDTTVQAWYPHAWDGADLPPTQTALRPATTVLAVGQTADFFWEPPAAGTYRLQLASAGGKPLMEQPLIVR